MDQPVNRLLKWFFAGQVRITIRLAFFVFFCVAVLLPYLTIRTQKERSDADQIKNRQATEQRIVERLQSPAGQLALQNPSRLQSPASPLRPVILPFAEIQADMPGVILDQVRAIGCPIQFKSSADAVLEQGTICAGLRKSDAQEVHGRLLVAGTFISASVIPHLFLEARAEEAGRPVATRFQGAHRIEVTLHDGKSQYQWILPVQVRIDPRTHRVREDLGLTAYRLDARSVPITVKPDFTGAWFTEGDCINPDEPVATCMREHSFSIAIPRERWGRQDARASAKDLTLDVVIFGPSVNGKPLPILDSRAQQTAFAPFGKSDLDSHLATGESLAVFRRTAGKSEEVFRLSRGQDAKPIGLENFGEKVLKLLGTGLTGADAVVEQRRSFGVRGDSYEMVYRSSVRGLDPELVRSAASVVAYAVLMIAVAAGAWLTIEFGVIRRVTRLTGRTRLVSLAIRTDGNLKQFDYSKLRGRDELGVLATGLDDLLKRIADDVQANAARLESERRLLRAIGHEIRGPLQSLTAVLAGSDPGEGYVRRMLKAVATLYGSSSPTDGFENAELENEKMDLAAFLDKVAQNSPLAGIDNVQYRGPRSGVQIKGDQSALEDVISHVLRNAQRYRPKGTPIDMALAVRSGTAFVSIQNSGPPIPADLIDRIFDYGVSETPEGPDGNQGQGLFVAVKYLAKMAGTISVTNLASGVEFMIELPVMPK